MQLPADQPLASVSVKPQPGWSYTVTRAKLSQPITDDDGNQVTDYPSVVDWKATAGGIKPGEYNEFQLSVGPLPKADSMTFKALQTYSNGETVSWIERAGRRQQRRARAPAPTLKLASAPTRRDRAHDQHRRPRQHLRRRGRQRLGHRRVRRRRDRPGRRAGRARRRGVRTAAADRRRAEPRARQLGRLSAGPTGPGATLPSCRAGPRLAPGAGLARGPALAGALRSRCAGYAFRGVRVARGALRGRRPRGGAVRPGSKRGRRVACGGAELRRVAPPRPAAAAAERLGRAVRAGVRRRRLRGGRDDQLRGRVQPGPAGRRPGHPGRQHRAGPCSVHTGLPRQHGRRGRLRRRSRGGRRLRGGAAGRRGQHRGQHGRAAGPAGGVRGQGRRGQAPLPGDLRQRPRRHLLAGPGRHRRVHSGPGRPVRGGRCGRRVRARRHRRRTCCAS